MDDLFSGTPGESSAVVRARVLSARALSRARAPSSRWNGALTARDLGRFAPLDAASRSVIRRAGETYGISARGVVRTRRVARTIADLAGKSQVSADHVMDALQFRMPIETR